jgi:hypothetical protein
LHTVAFLHFNVIINIIIIINNNSNTETTTKTSTNGKIIPTVHYKHDDLDGQGDHNNPTQFSDLDPALCTSGGGWSSLHSRLIDALLLAVEI